MTSIQMRPSPVVDSKRAVTPIKPMTGSPVSQREITCVSSQSPDLASRRPGVAGSPQKQSAGGRDSPARAPKSGTQTPSAKRASPYCDRKGNSNHEMDGASRDRAVVVHPSKDTSGSPCLVRSSDRSPIQEPVDKDFTDKGRDHVVYRRDCCR